MNTVSRKYNLTTSIKVLFCLICILSPFARLVAQPIPIGDVRDDQFRILQLLSDSTISTSYSNRPLWNSTYKSVFNKSNTAENTWWGKPIQFPEKTFSLKNYDFRIGGYEPVMTNTYNTDLPYGKNNGAAWYGRGLNSELKGGFYITSDYFTATLRPHLIYTQNKDFIPPRFVPTYPNGDIRYVAEGRLPEYQIGNIIDWPYRFGPDPYWTLDWGQSSVRLHYNAIEAGISNETLWWGPANQYALMMSNNAPGIPHLFIGTREPLKLPLNIGNIEFRWMLGRPESSEFFDLNVYGAKKNQAKFFETLQKTRVINGINLIYSPSFAPNLSLGLSRVIQQYVPEGGLSFSNDILAVFKSFPKPKDEVYDDWRDDGYFEQKDPKASVFFRWVFPESNAEFYGELYKGDHNVNTRDFLMEPQHGRAYTLGVQKLLQFDGPINFVKINAEINSLEQGPIDELRPQTYIYTHATIRQGYTNRGQLLGAAIGPGSASQLIGADGYFKNGKIGFFLQREVLNNHFYYELLDRYFAGGGFKDQIHHRINLNLGLRGSYQLGHILLNGKFTWNRNFNYGRRESAYYVFYSFPVPIVDNFQYQLSVRYLF